MAPLPGSPGPPPQPGLECHTSPTHPWDPHKAIFVQAQHEEKAWPSAALSLPSEVRRLEWPPASLSLSPGLGPTRHTSALPPDVPM